VNINMNFTKFMVINIKKINLFNLIEKFYLKNKFNVKTKCMKIKKLVRNKIVIQSRKV